MGILAFVLMLVILVVLTCNFRNVKRDDIGVLYNLYFDKNGFPIWEELKKDLPKTRLKSKMENTIVPDAEHKSALKEMEGKLEVLLVAEKAGRVDLADLRNLIDELIEQDSTVNDKPSR